MGVGLNMSGSKSKSSTNSKTSSESWLYDIISPMVSQAVNANWSVPENVMAGLNEDQKSALDAIIKGQDWSGIQGSAGTLGSWANQVMGEANAMGAQANNTYSNTINSISGNNYQNLVKGFYNSDLVNQQLAVANNAVDKQLASQIQNVNQQAVMGGGIGSSRAGVAEGVAAGEAAAAKANAAATIQGNAWNQALSAAGTQANQMLSASQLGMNQYNSLANTASSTMNNSLGWLSNALYGQMTDQQNQFSAASIYQQQAQAEADTARLNQILASNPALAKLSMLLPVIGGTAGWQTSGTGSSNTSGSTFGWGMAAQLGNSAGAGTSDARLKDNIETIKEATNIMPRLVKWTWNDLAKKFFKSLGIEDDNYPPAYGVIAQEVLEKGLVDCVNRYDVSEDLLPGFEGYVLSVNYPKLHEVYLEKKEDEYV